MNHIYDIYDRGAMMRDDAYVIILHGLARSSSSMRQLEKSLGGSGYQTLNLDYSSRKLSVEACAAELLPTIKEQIPKNAPLHLVSHSMGGLVGRELMGLLPKPEWNWQSAVFLAPPHQGSKIARTLANHPATQSFFRWFYGPAGLQVTEAMTLPLPPCPFGVIAGTEERSLTNPTSWISPRIFPGKERSDGTVAVEETRLENMVDFIEVAFNHTTIMNHSQVHKLVLHFFERHIFPKEAQSQI